MKIVDIILLVLGIVVGLLLIAVIRTLKLESKTTNYEGSKDEKRIKEYSKKLQRMIKIDTTSYRDKPDPDKFRVLHKLLEEMYPNVFKKCKKIDIDGNLLVKWKGKNSKLNPIILISHLDVVPAEGHWTYPPFSGKIVDGKIYGRGTGDIKCNVMAFYQAVEELIKDGYKPECDVYLGSSCTEEIGGDGAPKIVNWFKKQGIKLFMLCDEGGGIVQNPIAGVKGDFAAVGIFEKGYGDLKITAKSNGGHSSTPKKNTPIPRLAGFINEVEKKNIFKKKFSKPVEAMFENIAPYISKFGLRLVMHNLWLFKPILVLVIDKISSEVGAMFKTTICFTMQKGSNGYNVIPSEAYVTANLRYIPHEGKDESNAKVAKLAKKYDLETEFIAGNNYSKALDLNGVPFKMTVECINKIFPNVGIMPYVVTGGTDSRFFDSVCDNCVRFSPILFTSEQLVGMHGLNENLIASTLPKAVDYFKELIKIQENR